MPLTRAEQLIDLLLARQQPRAVLEKTTRLPYGWALWLRSLGPLPQPYHARDVIAVLLPRPLPGPPGQSPQLSPWQALRRLFWQDWDAAPRDQRWMRWLSAVASALLHLLFFMLLLWVAVIRTTAPEAEGAEGERLQVEFVGRASQQGGGDQPGADAAAAAPAGQVAAGQEGGAATSPEPRPASRSSPAPAPAPAPTASLPPPPAEAEPAPLAAPPPSPVQATEVAQASADFVVPPVSVPRTEVSIVPRDTTPTVRERSVQPVQAPPVPTPLRAPEIAVPAPQLRDIPVQEREISTVDAPAISQPLRTADVQVRVPQRDVQLREREVQVVVDPQVRMAAVAGREPTVRAPAGRDLQVREREVASAPAAAPSTSSGSAPATTAAPAASGSARQAESSTPRPSASSTASAQAGARPAPDPGNWATPAKGDDWGASSRKQDGADKGARQASATGKGSGLFNADGSVRVPGQEGDGRAERGAPGGANDGWSKERIAQSGTWLKRPPYDYTPTSFDKYWVPQESLLAEWVRKGIKAMEIPLPGTNTKISCVISILQAGGGCGLTNPNMQDQPAVARPPPDIPFKKELQEDNGSR
ncbi:hypothetical protein D7T58_12425 [Stenotrophomonas maltophilia]|uniref:hypothetical protein n=1 Tax=Stenotrophomonas hibiscicola TaxID=86189 RepID=UPI00130FF163|nr:hypothetical protein [[Pseudomonas] hibiscicola]MBA0262893.1 hypothetical protein [Stenotrophomonas maltophilia]MBA0469503.1 hypothetical protein [Stenotrophomonas maltophilia]MBA0475123.1 hypothetical protein [Stenotrophomonas maltophilia]MBA0484155.1 hypothetical protein [Stenotrophomonas maltophilia]UXB14708.1 hypothetical protein K7565_12940 [Stenotrophomonas maltophilia]